MVGDVASTCTDLTQLNSEQLGKYRLSNLQVELEKNLQCKTAAPSAKQVAQVAFLPVLPIATWYKSLAPVARATFSVWAFVSKSTDGLKIPSAYINQETSDSGKPLDKHTEHMLCHIDTD